MRHLKVVLSIPQYKIRIATRQKWLADLKEFAASTDADLVVFPESFISRYFHEGTVESGNRILKKLAQDMDCAVISGFKTTDGFETALFYNPNPGRGETWQHLYYKHFLADKVAFELDDWESKVDEIFSPIRIKGQRLGVCVCYDMFWPAIIQAFENRGARVFIDLTGDNVVPHKWKTIVSGRSVESSSPFLCTMGYYHGWGGEAIALAFDRGLAMEMTLPGDEGAFESPVPPTFVCVAIPSVRTTDILPEKPYSGTWQNDITASLGTSARADIEIGRKGSRYIVSSHGKTCQIKKNEWSLIKGRHHKIALLCLGMEDLKDRSVLLRAAPSPFREADDVEHVVVYCGNNHSGLSQRDIISLASLRVIEHRIAALIMDGDCKEAIRQTKTKGVMRLEERNGLFGIRVNQMGRLLGPSVPEQYRDQYLSLI